MNYREGGKGIRVEWKRKGRSKPGTDPGEVIWVNFHPPFSEPPSFFFFLKHLNQGLVLLH